MGGETGQVNMERLRKLGEYAKELGYTQAQLAIAWVIANKDVSTCIMGFSRPEQFDDNIRALELYYKWNDEIENKCKEILHNEPEPDFDWRNYKPFP